MWGEATPEGYSTCVTVYRVSFKNTLSVKAGATSASLTMSNHGR